MPKRKRYEVLTWDAEKQDWTPQKGVRRGPYTLFGLRRAIRKLREIGYSGHRNDPSVYLERIGWLDEEIAKWKRAESCSAAEY
jgi:hypothetical protein